MKYSARKTLKFLNIFLGAVAIAAILTNLYLRTHPAKKILGSVPAFTLVDQNDQSFGSENLKGKFWVADFIFTRCMGPCPLVTHQMSQLQKEFSNQNNLMFVSFTVDPDFDRPPLLAKYSATYGDDPSRWVFLTGEKEKIYSLIQQNFHLAIAPESDNNFIHSLHFVLVNPKGEIIGYYNSTLEDEVIKLRDDLKKSL